MEKQTIELDTPMVVSGIKVVAVTETFMHVAQCCGKGSFMGYKRPLYIMVVMPQLAVRAFEINGEETTIERITAEHPCLKDPLAKL